SAMWQSFLHTRRPLLACFVEAKLPLTPSFRSPPVAGYIAVSRPHPLAVQGRRGGLAIYHALALALRFVDSLCYESTTCSSQVIVVECSPPTGTAVVVAFVYRAPDASTAVTAAIARAIYGASQLGHPLIAEGDMN